MTSEILNVTAIAVFVKTPGLSPVNTRLAASIGTAAAEQFYKLCTMAIRETLETASKTMDIAPFWAVGEEAGLCHPLWQGFEAIYTGEGGLGERQHHIYQTLLAKYQRVILIGADSPQLSSRHLNNAIEALENHSLDNNSFALGPAVDGGYYLLAGRAPIARDIWTNVKYSAADTAEQLLSQLPSKTALIEPITDVDTIDDLARVESELRVEKAINKNQKILLEYIVREFK
jgi:glycosyltransferase A (GT-A) superfamily protein (DUF2064 family)